MAESEPDLAVDVRGVSKAFGTVAALSDLNLRIPQGKITVLLGPNGAGKTTAIRIITGALPPDRGTVHTFGYDPNVLGEAVRSRCGVVSAKPALYDRLTGRHNLTYAAELYGLGRNATKEIDAAADRFGILHALDQQVGGYSTGMKTRLALSRSILHDPDLLLFDEPTSGLDPESSSAVLGLIRQMTDEGRTVVMCTHLLVEAEGLADEVIMLEAGKDLLSGPPEVLTARYWPNQLVRFDAEDRDTLKQLVDLPGVLAVNMNGHAEVEVDDITRVPDLVAQLTSTSVRLTRVEPHTPTLEELYFAVREERRHVVAALAPSADPRPMASSARAEAEAALRAEDPT